MEKMEFVEGEATATAKEKDRLEQEIALCHERLERAKQLACVVAAKDSHWEDRCGALEAAKGRAVGDALLASATTTFLGPFNGNIRAHLGGLKFTNSGEGLCGCGVASGYFSCFVVRARSTGAAQLADHVYSSPPLFFPRFTPHHTTHHLRKNK